MFERVMDRIDGSARTRPDTKSRPAPQPSIRPCVYTLDCPARSDSSVYTARPAWTPRVKTRPERSATISRSWWSASRCPERTLSSHPCSSGTAESGGGQGCNHPTSPSRFAVGEECPGMQASRCRQYVVELLSTGIGSCRHKYEAEDRLCAGCTYRSPPGPYCVSTVNGGTNWVRSRVPMGYIGEVPLSALQALNPPESRAVRVDALVIDSICPITK